MQPSDIYFSTRPSFYFLTLFTHHLVGDGVAEHVCGEHDGEDDGESSGGRGVEPALVGVVVPHLARAALEASAADDQGDQAQNLKLQSFLGLIYL